MSTYQINSMRVIKPSKAVAERHPDRFATVKGIFHDTNGNKLTISSKELTLDDVRNPETVIDLAKGILTLPSGNRGRKAVDSITQDDLNSELAAIRETATAK